MTGRPPRRLRRLQANWERFARDDPAWAILTDPAKAGGGWDIDDLLATGPPEVERWLSVVHPPPGSALALDVGCGLGRISQALADRFDRVLGLDIAPAMIEQARSLNRFGDRCTYQLNPGPGLPSVGDGSVDLVWCRLVLQHQSPVDVRAYLAEFVRVLAPTGAAVVQMPTRLDGRTRFWSTVGRLRQLLPTRRPRMQMIAMAPDAVEAVVTAAGGRVELAIPDHSAGAIESTCYILRPSPFPSPSPP